jgi:uncharacterized protein YqhQ
MAQATANQRVQDGSVVLAMVVGVAFGLILFTYVPNLIAEQFTRRNLVTDYRVVNFITEVLKVIIFLGYIYGIGRIPDVRRVFKYHGAEHKAINTLEAHQELNEANCLAQTRLHPRCGTSFAIVVLLVSMLSFTFIPRYPIESLRGNLILAPTVRFFVEIVILPLVAGVSYEMIRLAGKFRNTAIIKALFWPGLMTQYLTTVEPDPDQAEVALVALRAVVDAEGKGMTEAKVDEAAAAIA